MKLPNRICVQQARRVCWSEFAFQHQSRPLGSGERMSGKVENRCPGESAPESTEGDLSAFEYPSGMKAASDSVRFQSHIRKRTETIHRRGSRAAHHQSRRFRRNGNFAAQPRLRILTERMNNRCTLDQIAI